MPTVSPMLSVRRGAQAVAFYEAEFAATVLFRIDDEASGAVVAQLSIDGAEFSANSGSGLNF